MDSKVVLIKFAHPLANYKLRYAEIQICSMSSMDVLDVVLKALSIATPYTYNNIREGFHYLCSKGFGLLRKVTDLIYQRCLGLFLAKVCRYHWHY